MDITQKIIEKIRNKKDELEKLRKSEEKFRRERIKRIEEDFKFRNFFNPFYKRKYDSRGENIVILALVLAFMETGLEKEIEELQELLN